MASFMSIPEELRDTIIELVLLHERTSPGNVAEAQNGRCGIKNSDYGTLVCWDYGPLNVLYEKAAVVPSSWALLLTNRELHEQTKAAISRLFPTGPKYKLDALLVNERQLWPTWTHIPALSRQVDVVDVTIRIIGRNIGAGLENAMIYASGGPPQIIWCFYYLMEHFLEFGTASSAASWTGKHLGQKRDHSVNTIRLNFISIDADKLIPNDTMELRLKFWERQYQQGRGWNPSVFESDEVLLAADEPVRLHPNWLAKFIGDELEGLLPMYHHYGALIYERIGIIKVFSQGELVSEINPGNVLPGLVKEPERHSRWRCSRTFDHLAGDCRLLTFWNWKFRAVNERKRRGLSLVGEVIWPRLEELKWWRAARDECRQTVGNPGWLGSGLCDDRCLCDDRQLERMLEGRGM